MYRRPTTPTRTVRNAEHGITDSTTAFHTDDL
jgi:hypothetical protein